MTQASSLSIRNWLTNATKELSAVGIPSARLDAELVLAHTLQKSRTWLHSHDDDTIGDRLLPIANARLTMRQERVPLAYITGHKEFYGRRFGVNPSVLIPRPESEDIITLIKTLPNITALIDIGCGSGALGITAKLELPNTSVTLADISNAALGVAKNNATTLAAHVLCVQSDLLSSLDLATEKFDMIVANLPYVNPEWETSPEVDYEPSLALYADNNGLALIYTLLEQTASHLLPNGYVILEADPVQHPAIIKKAKTHSLQYVQTMGYALLLQVV